MRDWAHEDFKQILPGASGASSAAGPGPPRRAARNAMGGDPMQTLACPANLQRVAVDDPCGPRECRPRRCVGVPVRRALRGRTHGHQHDQRDRARPEQASLPCPSPSAFRADACAASLCIRAFAYPSERRRPAGDGFLRGQTTEHTAPARATFPGNFPLSGVVTVCVHRAASCSRSTARAASSPPHSSPRLRRVLHRAMTTGRARRTRVRVRRASVSPPVSGHRGRPW